MTYLKKSNYATLILIIGLLFMFSCNTGEDVLETSEEINQLEKSRERSSSDDNPEVCFNSAKKTCDNLVYDSVNCTFTNGESTDMDARDLMIDILNCNTESLPSGCEWAGSPFVLTFQRTMTNCCYDYTALNNQVGYWRYLAEGLASSNRYVLLEYELGGGYMQTSYGPYVQTIKVTFRKKRCLFIQK